MLGTSLPSSNTLATAPSSSLSARDSSTHRRNSSLEASAATQLGSSPNKSVKMLNGRVYGSRRASQGQKTSEEWRKEIEPQFVEWGSPATSMGSAPASGGGSTRKGSSLLGDDDDGSGMDWVRKRRERKEREERERRESESASVGGGAGESPETTSLGLPSLVSHSQSTESSPAAQQAQPITPISSVADLPPTPVIHISEHFSPPNNNNGKNNGFESFGSPVPEASGAIVGAVGSQSNFNNSGSSGAMNISSSPMRDRDNEARDVFDEEKSTSRSSRPGHVRRESNGNAIASDSESEEEEDSDDGDFSDDVEAEEDKTR